jgi:YHS domain-containing protein
LIDARHCPAQEGDSTMTHLEELDRQIEEKLALQKQSSLDHHNHFAEEMHERDERHQRYTACADRTIREVIRPRVERLARRFDNAKILEGDQASRHSCVCCFAHTPRYPATAKLEVCITRDGDYRHVFLLYDLCILPVFFKFEGHDELAMPLERLDEKQIAEWVEKKLLDFLDTYLRLETIEQYQVDNYVTDPVCKMRINRLFATAHAEHGGKTYYFCIPECKEKFAAAPESYVR